MRCSVGRVPPAFAIALQYLAFCDKVDSSRQIGRTISDYVIRGGEELSKEWRKGKEEDGTKTNWIGLTVDYLAK
jgi:hypothetical protein